MGYIYIQPIGDIEKPIIDGLKQALEVRFSDTTIEVYPQVAIPIHAYHPKRGQYNAKVILEEVKGEIGTAGKRTLAIINVDLYSETMPQERFVFGDIIGKICVISTYRLRPEVYGGEQNLGLVLMRVLKEGLHLLGHTFGLAHCRNPKCPMFATSNLHEIDNKSSSICSFCRSFMR